MSKFLILVKTNFSAPETFCSSQSCISYQLLHVGTVSIELLKQLTPTVILCQVRADKRCILDPRYGAGCRQDLLVEGVGGECCIRECRVGGIVSL